MPLLSTCRPTSSGIFRRIGMRPHVFQMWGLTADIARRWRTPTQAAVNFFTKLHNEAALIGPPYNSYPAPLVTGEAWTQYEAEVQRAGESDAVFQKRRAIKGQHPSVARLIPALLRSIAAAGF